MSKVTDYNNKIELDEDGEAVTETFSDFVLANKQCSLCGKPMRLMRSKRGTFFYACTGYPNCEGKEWPEADFVEKYIYRNGGPGQLCVRCQHSMEAKKGMYGVYIECCGYPTHRRNFLL